MGHVKRVCKSETEEAKVTMKEEEDDELFSSHNDLLQETSQAIHG